MGRITNITEFREAKQKFMRKHGEALVTQTTEEVKRMIRDIGPIAKYSTMPCDQMLRLIAREYVEGRRS